MFAIICYQMVDNLSYIFISNPPCLTPSREVRFIIICPHSHLFCLSYFVLISLFLSHFLAVNVWNQCAMRLVGYTINEVMGKNLVQEFITKEYRAAVSAVLDKALRGKETANFEFPLITKNGVRIEVLLNATTRRDEQGNVIGVVGIGQDITARLAQEREYSKLIDTANAPIFGVDTEVNQFVF